ncbi:MAG TPA: cytochrome c, partial [Rhodanobacteraceae bacterium]|nr:cytochrome c [Rhodanobacteraceae bacterium]
MGRCALKSWTVLLACGLATALAGCSDEKKSAQNGPTPADLSSGKVIAQTSCQPCHGSDGRGAAPGIPTLAGEPQQYLVASLAEYKEGKRLHGALRNIAGNLTEADTRNVAGYFASLKRAAPNGGAVFSPYDHGKTVAPACVTCHG